MRAALLAFGLGLAGVEAAAQSCEPMLSERVVFSTSLERFDASVLADRPRVDADRLAVVLGSADDEWLAIDARATVATGDVFATSRAWIEDPDGERSVAWRTELTKRIEGYTEFGRPAADLAATLGSAHRLKHVRDIFFSRFFDSAVATSTRLSLVTARVPSPAPNDPGTIPEISNALDLRRFDPRAGSWFTMSDKRVTREVIYEPEDGTTARGFVLAIPTRIQFFRPYAYRAGETRRLLTGSDVVHLPVFSLQNGLDGNVSSPHVLEMHYGTEDKIDVARVKAAAPATHAEIMIQSAEFNANFVEDATAVRVTSSEGEFEIRVPKILSLIDVPSAITYRQMISSAARLVEGDADLRLRLQNLKPGGRTFAMRSDSRQVNTGYIRPEVTRRGFTMIFGRDALGRLNVLAWMYLPIL